MDGDGMSVEGLEAALKANPSAKLIYTIPSGSAVNFNISLIADG